MNMPVPWDQDAINEAHRSVVRENGLETAYIRPMCFYGSEGMGLRADNLRVHAIVAAWEWGTYLGAENMERGIRIKTSSFTRHHVNITMCKAKANGNYMNSMMALKEALDNGYDEALLLDANGFVMEGSGENIFIVRDGVIYTPDLTSALDGITRKTVMQLANEAGYQVIEKRITRDEVYIADEAFFTGTAAEVTPIREIDGREIGSGTRGPITEQLQSKYFDVKSSADKPRWFMVDIKYIRHTGRVIPLTELKQQEPLENMPLVRKGNRLSIMPVSKAEWDYILQIE